MVIYYIFFFECSGHYFPFIFFHDHFFVDFFFTENCSFFLWTYIYIRGHVRVIIIFFSVRVCAFVSSLYGERCAKGWPRKSGVDVLNGNQYKGRRGGAAAADEYSFPVSFCWVRSITTGSYLRHRAVRFPFNSVSITHAGGSRPSSPHKCSCPSVLSPRAPPPHRSSD